MLWALRIVVKLGKEFCSSSSLILIECVKDKSDQFFNRFHEESFQIIRMMIEAELWQSIPLEKNGDNSGIAGLIKSSISRESFSVSLQPKETVTTPGKSFTRRASLHRSLQTALHQHVTEVPNGAQDFISSTSNVEDIESEYILVNFGISGNPFHFINNHYEETNNSVRLPKYLVNETIGTGLWDIFNEENQKVTKKNKLASSTIVVTQAILNGLSKYSVKYLEMISLLPDAGLKIFESLCHLYNYYLCAVFHGFVPSEDKDKLLSLLSKMITPPPDTCREFEVSTFCCYLVLSLNNN
jgi:hypothetical protein